jgi:hypothetical protein
MTPFLLLAPAGLALLLLASSRLADEWHVAAVRLASGAGMLLGLSLALTGAQGSSWRVVSLEPGPTSLAGLAAVLAWFLVGVLDGENGSWDKAAAVGVGTSSLGLMLTSEWVVPTLLFAFCFLTAMGLLVAAAAAREVLWIFIGAGGVLLGGALVVAQLDTSTWPMPDIEGGPALGMLLAGVVALAVGMGWWGRAGSAGSAGAAVVPLLGAAAFGVLGGSGAGAQAVSGAVVLAGAALVGAATVRFGHEHEASGLWAVLIGLGVALVAPSAAYPAGIATVIALAAGSFEPRDHRAGPETSLVTSFSPLTAGFAVLSFGAVEAFDQAAVRSGSDAAPWVAVSALFPAALAGGIYLAARIARQARGVWRHGLTPSLVLAAVAVLFGFFPRVLTRLPEAPLSTGGGTGGLYILALIAGGAAIWAVLHDTDATPRANEASLESRVKVVLTRPAHRRTARLIALVLGIAVFAGAGWLTFEGLRVGFL